MTENPHFSVEISVNIGAVNMILTDAMDSVKINSGENFLKQNRVRTAISQPYHHGDLPQALIEAAQELLTNDQNDGFSLREVAAHAGVSHNAPYNHFADKRELLTAVAATGYEALRERMLAATANIDNPEAALIQSGIAYVCFGVENPSLFRLMFGSKLSTIKQDGESALGLAAAAARSVLEQIIRRGVLAGVFVPSLRGAKGQEVLVLATWSIVHGLTTLAIDGTVRGTRPVSMTMLRRSAERSVTAWFVDDSGLF
jgi:AcrR family transcriptional regulator